jgi:hypothetical protein
MDGFNMEGEWERDEEVTHCGTCKEAFGVLLWKHHCRKVSMGV